jgi:hypothetical protein
MWLANVLQAVASGLLIAALLWASRKMRPAWEFVRALKDLPAADLDLLRATTANTRAIERLTDRLDQHELSHRGGQ